MHGSATTFSEIWVVWVYHDFKWDVKCVDLPQLWVKYELHGSTTTLSEIWSAWIYRSFDCDAFFKTNSVSSTYKRGSEPNLLLSSVDYGKPIKHLSHESSHFCHEMMLRMCIWFVESIFLLSRRQRSVEQWYLNMILWSTLNRMICLWMKSTTATLVVRC